MVIFYYFSGCFLILDLFVLFVMINNSVNHFDDFLPQIPLVIFWVFSIAILITIFIFEKLAFNNIKNYFRQKYIVNVKDVIESKNLEKISKRLCNLKPISYKPISYTYILCFIPVMYKYFDSSLRYSTTFLYVSIIFCSTGFVYYIYKFFFYKYTNKESKKGIYYNIFQQINPEYYYTKMYKILKYYPEWNLSEGRLAFLYYFWLAVFHGAIIFYAYLMGKKLDDSNFTLSWRILLIPLYIICFIIVLWGIIYIY